MKKNLTYGILSFLLLGTLIGLASAEMQANPPEIQILSVSYTDQLGNPLSMPYYSWDHLFVTAIISDQESWYDVIKPDLLFGNYSLNCYRVEILSEDDAKYECHLTILPYMTGEYELHLNAVDKAGLFDDEIVGTYYFNPPTTLSHDPLLFNPADWIMGQHAETEWINVNINAPVNVENPVEVVLYGKNLYEDLSNCREENICVNFERVCHEEITGYKERTKRECKKVPYEKEYTKRVCSYVLGKRVCKTETYTKVLNKTVCENVPYQQPIIKKICENTENCLSWRTIKKCDSSRLHQCGDSNMMKLENFEYMIEGTSEWKQVQVEPHKEVIFNGNGDSDFRIKFKVNIPDPCYGDYVLDGRNLFIKLH